MPLNNATPLTFTPRGVTDSIDSTAGARGSMAALQNLVPSPTTPRIFVPRPAAQLINDFSSFNTPDQGEALFVSGPRYYGFIQSAKFTGNSEPYVYDSSVPGFVSISGMTASNTPAQTLNTGDWTPPTVTRAGGRVIFTHPGFALPNAFGWLDMTGFSDATRTGDTHTSTLIDALSVNVLQAGWRPGMTITDSAGDLPAATRIVSIASNGLSLIVSAAATGANVGTTFTVAGGTLAAPLWCAGNINGLPLLAVASCVAQFNGRIYYGVGSAVEFSDSNDPLQASGTAITQVITFGNGINVTALKGLGLYQTTGGILAALIVFQGAAAVSQITGDPALNTLALNQLSESTGTLAPNACAQIPNLGLAFMAPDGMRVITPSGSITEPLGANGEGIAYPFMNATNPSRMCAAYNEDVYRISVTGNLALGGETQTTISAQEYWLHIKLNVWSGPHSFPARLIEGSQVTNSFVEFPLSAGGLWSSDPIPTINSNYLENGATMTYLYLTSLLPDTGEMAENAMIETAIGISVGVQVSAQATFQNEGGVVLDSQPLVGIGGNPGIWGAMIWGEGLWGQGSVSYRQRRIPWALPLVFKQGQFSVSGPADGSVAIGNVYMRYQRKGYLMQGLDDAV